MVMPENSSATARSEYACTYHKSSCKFVFNSEDSVYNHQLTVMFQYAYRVFQHTNGSTWREKNKQKKTKKKKKKKMRARLQTQKQGKRKH